MPKRFHLKRPDLAAAVTIALGQCDKVGDQQRLLAMRLACSGELTAEQIAEQVGISRRQFFNWIEALKEAGKQPEGDNPREQDVIATLHLIRPSIVLLTLGLVAAGFGIVLYNVVLSGLAIGLLILGFARPAPATA